MEASPGTGKTTRVPSAVLCLVRDEVLRWPPLGNSPLLGENLLIPFMKSNPALMEALVDLNYPGYIGHEFVPKRAPLASLRQAVDFCDA